VCFWVIFVLAWPAILHASIKQPTTSCRQAMLPRWKERSQQPGKLQTQRIVCRAVSISDSDDCTWTQHLALRPMIGARLGRSDDLILPMIMPVIKSRFRGAPRRQAREHEGGYHSPS